MNCKERDKNEVCDTPERAEACPGTPQAEPADSAAEAAEASEPADGAAAPAGLAEGGEAAAAEAQDSEAPADSEADGMTDGPAEAPQAGEADGDPLYDPLDEDLPAEEEGDNFSVLRQVKAWLILVAVALVVLLGAALGLLYLITDMDSVPAAAVTFEGQELTEGGYRWRVPVAGPVQRTFRRKLPDEPQQLETVTVADPELVCADGFDVNLQVQNAAGETVFEGTGESFAVFSFTEDGDYTAHLTADKRAGKNVTGHIPQGRYEYEFAFRISAVPEVKASRENVVQGSAFTLTLSGVLGDTLPRLEAPFAPKAVFVPRGRDWVACVDVPYDCPTGDYQVRVISGDNVLEQHVFIYARKLRELDTNTPDGSALAPFVGALPAALEPYMEITDPDIYWTDEFVQPVKGTLIRDYYVDEYADRIVDPLLMQLVPDIVKAINEAIEPRLSLNVTFSLPAGSKVVCPADGRVVFAGTVQGGGRTLVIEHGGGLKSIFYLMNGMQVSEGDFVYKEQTVGTTNDHIICEMRLNGTAINPWDVWRNLGALATF